MNGRAEPEPIFGFFEVPNSEYNQSECDKWDRYIKQEKAKGLGTRNYQQEAFKEFFDVEEEEDLNNDELY